MQQAILRRQARDELLQQAFFATASIVRPQLQSWGPAPKASGFLQRHADTRAKAID